MIRVFIRKFFPIELRLLREAIKIYIFKKLNVSSFSIGPKEFPVGLNGSIAFYTYPFLKCNGKKYFSQIYGADKVTDTMIHQRGYMHFVSEVIEGDMHKGRYVFSTSKEVVIPISIPNKNTDNSDGKLKVEINNDVINLRGLKKNSFNYFSFPTNKDITINSYNDSIIVGSPIVKKDHNPNNKKLVLSIFIDGLASEVFKKVDFSTLMPFTSDYFNDGLIFLNGYANANWTLPSVPSIVSGIYPINHKIYNSVDVQHIGDGYSVASEYFKKNGYLTCQIDNVMRKSPTYNYAKGFDRTLYKHSMPCKDVIMHAIEHLTAFSGRDNYLWLSLFELHHNLYGTPDISTQVNTPLHAYESKSSSKKSPFASYDKNSSERYILEIKRLDMYLGLLYDFLNKNYKDDDVVLSICSDHGQAFLSEGDELLSEYKIKVPMMFKSTNIDPLVTDEIVENVDYLPTLLKASGLTCEYDKINGKLPYSAGGDSKKDLAICEDIHQNSKYYAAVYGIKYILFAESKEIINSVEEIDLMNCKYRLFDRKSNTVVENGVCSNSSELAERHILFLRKHMHKKNSFV